MEKLRNHRRGTSVLEYTAMIVIIAAALAGMSVYLKRALCGSYRVVGDAFGHGRQYDPDATFVRESGTF